MIILLQVSSEMWDFDPSGIWVWFVWVLYCTLQGDVYCDKAIDGFLKDLFRKWKVSYFDGLESNVLCISGESV